MFGTYLHGLFDSGTLTEALARALCHKKGIDYRTAAPVNRSDYLNQQYDKLAAGVRAALDMDAIYRMMEE